MGPRIISTSIQRGENGDSRSSLTDDNRFSEGEIGPISETGSETEDRMGS